MQDRSNSPLTRDPSGCAVGFKCMLEKKKRLFLPQTLTPPKRGREGGERKEEEERRRKRRQSFPLSLPLSDDASLSCASEKPSSLGQAGIQTVVHFTRRKSNKTHPKRLLGPAEETEQLHGRREEEEEALCRQSEEREGRPGLKAFVCSFQTDLAWTKPLRPHGRGAETTNVRSAYFKQYSVIREDPDGVIIALHFDET